MKNKMLRLALCAASLGIVSQFSIIQAQDEPQKGGEGKNRPERDMFKMTDLNEDGKVSMDEIVEFGKKRMEQRAKRAGGSSDENAGPPRGGANSEERASKRLERISEAFAKADADEDGFLTREEFAAMPNLGKGRGGPQGRSGDGEKPKKKAK